MPRARMAEPVPVGKAWAATTCAVWKRSAPPRRTILRVGGVAARAVETKANVALIPAATITASDRVLRPDMFMARPPVDVVGCLGTEARVPEGCHIRPGRTKVSPSGRSADHLPRGGEGSGSGAKAGTGS